MKPLTFIILLSVAACNRESSPDGRSQLRDEKLQKEINYLKDQHTALLDSINAINKRLADFERK